MAILDTAFEETLTSNGNTAEFVHHGGELLVGVQGNHGTGSPVATLQASFDGGTTWGTATDIVTGNTLVVSGGTTGAAYGGSFSFPPCRVRFNLAGSISPSLGLYAARANGPRVQ
ncbi:MAG: hypothetical protein AAGI37_15545 [Planctomycetota bacterium]